MEDLGERRQRKSNGNVQETSGNGKKPWKRNFVRKLSKDPITWELSPEFDLYLTRSIEDVYSVCKFGPLVPCFVGGHC